MAYVSLTNPLPGITGLLASYPATAPALGMIGDALLHRDDGLSRCERELIAAFVSAGNRCTYCSTMHSAIACAHDGSDPDLVTAVVAADDVPGLDDVRGVTPRLRTLLALAEEVRRGGDQVQVATLDAARDAGASDLEIHDTVLIAAAFCMFNRYVDGLKTALPDDPAWYESRGQRLAEQGYGPPRS